MGKAHENEAQAKRMVSACLKDHEKSMPTPLKFDRTCDFDIMTCVRKRRVACGAIVHQLKSKQNIRYPGCQRYGSLLAALNLPCCERKLARSQFVLI